MTPIPPKNPTKSLPTSRSCNCGLSSVGGKIRSRPQPLRSIISTTVSGLCVSGTSCKWPIYFRHLPVRWAERNERRGGVRKHCSAGTHHGTLTCLCRQSVQPVLRCRWSAEVSSWHGIDIGRKRPRLCAQQLELPQGSGEISTLQAHRRQELYFNAVPMGNCLSIRPNCHSSCHTTTSAEVTKRHIEPPVSWLAFRAASPPCRYVPASNSTSHPYKHLPSHLT